MSTTRREHIYEIRTKNEKCDFCHKSDSDELNLGKFHKLGDTKVHYFCMLLSSGLVQSGTDDQGILGFMNSDIKDELRRGQKLKCGYCKRTGATIGCAENRCSLKFHLPCAVRNHSLHQFYGVFPSFCERHKPRQKIWKKDYENFHSGTKICGICLLSIEKLCPHSTLKATCCKNTFFHRACVQKQAVNSGYFFKCPLCNNKEKFQKEMLEYGIYIPEQDASWELENNAYHELYIRHNRCDMPECLCPKGRFKNDESPESDWRLFLCNSCGSQGCHMRCANIRWRYYKWECESCRSINRRRNSVPSPPPKRPRINDSSNLVQNNWEMTEERTESEKNDSSRSENSETDTADSAKESDADIDIDVETCEEIQKPTQNLPKNFEPEVINITDSDESDDEMTDAEIFPKYRKNIFFRPKFGETSSESPEIGSVNPEKSTFPMKVAPHIEEMTNLTPGPSKNGAADDDRSGIESETDPGSFFNFDSDSEIQVRRNGSSLVKSLDTSDEPDTEIWVPETDKKYEFYAHTGKSGVKIVVMTAGLSSSETD